MSAGGDGRAPPVCVGEKHIRALSCCAIKACMCASLFAASALSRFSTLMLRLRKPRGRLCCISSSLSICSRLLCSLSICSMGSVSCNPMSEPERVRSSAGGGRGVCTGVCGCCACPRVWIWMGVCVSGCGPVCSCCSANGGCANTDSPVKPRPGSNGLCAGDEAGDGEGIGDAGRLVSDVGSAPEKEPAEAMELRLLLVGVGVEALDMDSCRSDLVLLGGVEAADNRLELEEGDEENERRICMFMFICAYCDCDVCMGGGESSVSAAVRSASVCTRIAGDITGESR